MPQSLAKIYVHIIFSTKDRFPCLTKEVCDELYPYIATVLKSEDCFPEMIGGIEDHVHILCTLSKNVSLAKLVKEIKISTSQFLKNKGVAHGRFCWQPGYGAFSVAQSSFAKTVRYIQNQFEHHKKMNFKDEFRALLKLYNIDYEENYLWD